MNTHPPKPSNHQSKQPSKNANEKRPVEPTTPITPPLSSPEEPTRAYPADSSKTYSSDPSQYAYDPNQPASNESKGYTTEPLDTARVASDHMRSSKNQTGREQEEAFKEKNRQTSNQKGNAGKKKDFYTYAAPNKEYATTYILLILGLITLLFFSNLLGGLILGIVAGFYFASDIVYYIRNLGQMMSGQDHLRYVILAAILLGFFIAAPGIFIGALIVATFKQVMAGNSPSNQ